MRIVDRATFLALPAGTLFAKYETCMFGPLAIKGESLSPCGSPVDFDYATIGDAIEYADICEYTALLDTLQASNGATSVPMDFETEVRDGLFTVDQLFAVWDRDDVDALIDRLFSALGSAYGVHLCCGCCCRVCGHGHGAGRQSHTEACKQRNVRGV